MSPDFDLPGEFDLREFDLLVFDKDGTLIDFDATWGPAVHETLQYFAADDAELRAAAGAVGFDVDNERIVAGSPVLAESNAEIHRRLLAVFPGLDADEFDRVGLEASLGSLAAIDGVGDALQRLRDCHVVLAVATNDAELAASRQLGALGWAQHFSAIVGYDSGHGSKPAPDMVIAAAEIAQRQERVEVPPGRIAMVGDSSHDLDAAKGAGYTSVYVGVDPVVAATADIVLDSVADFA